MKEKEAGKWVQGKYSVKYDPSPGASDLPESILELEPGYVDIENTCVFIGSIGGFAHGGVYAYAVDAPDQGKGADIKIINGLWFREF